MTEPVKTKSNRNMHAIILAVYRDNSDNRWSS